MSSLNASLATALSGLTAEQGALEATTNNVANANTPGYSREVPDLRGQRPDHRGPVDAGTRRDLAMDRKRARSDPGIPNPAGNADAGPVERAGFSVIANAGKLRQRERRYRWRDFELLQ